jgi:hypothetical protein
VSVNKKNVKDIAKEYYHSEQNNYLQSTRFSPYPLSFDAKILANKKRVLILTGYGSLFLFDLKVDKTIEVNRHDSKHQLFLVNDKE